MTEKPSGAQCENIITILAHDDQNGRIVASALDVEALDGEYRLIAERCVTYWRQYGHAPKAHTADLFADILEDPTNRRASLIRRILMQMAMLSEGINAKYVVDTLQRKNREGQLKEAILRSAEIITRQGDSSIEDVEEILADIMRARNQMFERGVKLDDPLEEFIEWLRNDNREFSTGIAVLDRRGIVPARKRIFLLIGPKGGGKSWFLVGVAKAALLRRLRVLHISLENSENETRMRYYQSLFGVPQQSAEMTRAPIILRDGNGDIRAIEHEDVPVQFDLNSPVLAEELAARMEQLRGKESNLIIKQFPNRALSVEMLSAYLDSIEMVDGFIPDLMVLDYPKLMKQNARSASDYRISLGHNLERLRALAFERNLALVVVDQLNRKGNENEVARSTDIGEDISQIQTADIVLTYSATRPERQFGLARVYVEHARSKKDKFGLLITQHLDRGQFCTDSVVLPDDYFDTLMPTNGVAETYEEDNGVPGD